MQIHYFDKTWLRQNLIQGKLEDRVNFPRNRGKFSKPHGKITEEKTHGHGKFRTHRCKFSKSPGKFWEGHCKKFEKRKHNEA